ncbi:hypothetical protein J619_04193 [Acinetobacter sp. 478810]|nr:hypothetical protein J619_04193 [Acinetobacter sp. 478810]
MQHIEDLTHRIEFKGQLEQPKTEVEEHKVAPPVHSEMTENPRLEPGQKDDGLTTNYDGLTTNYDGLTT